MLWNISLWVLKQVTQVLWNDILIKHYYSQLNCMRGNRRLQNSVPNKTSSWVLSSWQRYILAVRSSLWVKLLTPSLTGFCCSQQWLPSAVTQKQFHHSSPVVGTQHQKLSHKSVFCSQTWGFCRSHCYFPQHLLQNCEWHLMLSENSWYFNSYQVGVFKNIVFHTLFHSALSQLCISIQQMNWQVKDEIV